MRKIPLKNYTSTVPASRSVLHIKEQLVKAGAVKMIEDYDRATGSLTGLYFVLQLKDNRQVPFKIPAQVDAVRAHLTECEKQGRRRVSITAAERIKAQAERTAWKILSDWIDIQLTLIELQQVDPLEVFLAYVYDQHKNQTFFEKLESNGFKELTYKPEA
jgi:hypothetical protein